MKISIITGTYNSAKTVKDTFESILSQSFSDIEYMVIDGGSTDGTVDIIKEYEPRFEGRMRWISERDKGIYDAMNKGIAMATGDFVGILNSDDFYYDSEVLASIAETIQKTAADCVFGDLVFVDVEDTSIVRRVWKGSEYKPNSFKKGWAPAHPTFYAKRELFDKYGLFNIDYKVSADFDLMLRFVGVHGAKSAYIPRYFVKMRMGGESTGSIKSIIKGNMDIVHVLRENGYHVTYFYIVRRIAPKVWDSVLCKLGIRKVNK